MKRLLYAILVVALILPTFAFADDAGDAYNVATVSTEEELLDALQDENVQRVVFESKKDLEMLGEGKEIIISKPLDIVGSLTFVRYIVDLRSTITVSGNLALGEATLNNNGYIRVRNNSTLGSYMSNLMNYGAIYIEKDAVLECDRGGGWINVGALINEGTIRVTDDGGNADLQADSILDNRGIIDVTSTNFHNQDATIIGDSDAVLAVISAD